MSPVPELGGFIEAQANLRSTVGTNVTFLVPVAKVWPEKTKINPDTGLPYDSTIKQISAEFREVVKACLIILKQGSPLRPQSDTAIMPAGELSGMDIILDIAGTDKADVEEAAEMIVNGLTYGVREFKPFAIGETIYRYLVYGEER